MLEFILIIKLTTGEVGSQAVSPDLCTRVSEAVAAGSVVRLELLDGRIEEVLEATCEPPDPCDCQQEDASS